MDERDRINPYAAPAHSDGPEPVAYEPVIASRPYTSNASRTFWLVMFLGLAIPLVVAQAVLEFKLRQDIWRNVAAGETGVVDQRALQHISRLTNVIFSRLVLLLLTALAFSRWIHRAYGNLPALGADQLAMTPGRTVASLFVWGVKLSRPLDVMREIWRASDPDVGATTAETRRELRASPILGWWWATWLLVVLLGGLVFCHGLWSGGADLWPLYVVHGLVLSEQLYTGTADDWMPYAWLSVSALDYILACLLAIVVVRGIQARQRRKQAARSMGQ